MWYDCVAFALFAWLFFDPLHFNVMYELLCQTNILLRDHSENYWEWRFFNFCWQNLGAPLQGLAESGCPPPRIGTIWVPPPKKKSGCPLRRLGKSGCHPLTNSEIWVPIPQNPPSHSNVFWVVPNRLYVSEGLIRKKVCVCVYFKRLCLAGYL